MISAMGNEQRLRIMRLLIVSHPDGMVVGDIQSELGIPWSTLSHHLEKLKIAGLVGVKRETAASLRNKERSYFGCGSPGSVEYEHILCVAA